MEPPDIICFGTGRSGTSFTCKVLHEELGVCWGSGVDPNRPKKGMRHGVWEDSNMKGWNRYLSHNKLTPQQWIEQFNRAHTKCKKKKEFHGVKDPYLALCTPLVWKYIRPRLLIHCWRTPTQTIESRKKNSLVRPVEYWEWMHEIALYNTGKLQRMAHFWDIRWLFLDFSTEREPRYVLDSIKPILERMSERRANPSS